MSARDFMVTYEEQFLNEKITAYFNLLNNDEVKEDIINKAKENIINSLEKITLAPSDLFRIISEKFEYLHKGKICEYNYRIEESYKELEQLDEKYKELENKYNRMVNEFENNPLIKIIKEIDKISSIIKDYPK